MPKRTVCIQSPSQLSVRHFSLIVTQKDRSISIPFEDIWVLILETPQASITTKALSVLVDSGIGVMTCGANHMPNGLLLPIGAHSRHAAIVEDQLLISQPLRKRLWQRIVIAKIINQKNVLEYLGKDFSPLKQYASQVHSGDKTSRESVAASAYFKELLPSGTRRNGPYTAALDYGYAVLRAGIARKAVSGGWLVSRGIFHSNELNAFNLVDDLIEPFRPVVDLDVVLNDIRDLNSDTKRVLVRVFEHEVMVGGERMSVQTAIETEVDSLRNAILTKDAKLLLLPQVVGNEYIASSE